ncbi:NepR family anti-sigma factor [Sulfitobacter noctilucae]|uniref:NepR family anti-sigma factor n=1 Tax=Sulfitobacter noctilucae TaxID=1342302 RepID=UPI0004690258|nr:NepR family anti-sigma factor [Sulfitobacter noctilucae]
MTNSRKDERERAIDENLKRVFDQTLEEGIPDRFKNLLNQLKQQESSPESQK